MNDVTCVFNTEGGWAEYHLVFTRQDPNANIDISGIEIHSTDELESIKSATTTGRPRHSGTYDLSGRRVSPDTKGILIIDGKKQVR